LLKLPEPTELVFWNPLIPRQFFFLTNLWKVAYMIMINSNATDIVSGGGLRIFVWAMFFFCRKIKLVSCVCKKIKFESKVRILDPFLLLFAISTVHIWKLRNRIRSFDFGLLFNRLYQQKGSWTANLLQEVHVGKNLVINWVSLISFCMRLSYRKFNEKNYLSKT